MTDEQNAIIDSLSPRAPIHLFVPSGYTSLCCAKSANGRNPCARERDDKCHERSFPIYHIGAQWVQDGERGTAGPDSWWVRGLPDGRVRNRTGFYVMRRIADYVGEHNAAAEWFTRYRAEKESGNPWSDVDLTVESIGEETWCQGWFSHWRFDLDESDADVIANFRRYVSRRQQQNDEAYDKWDGEGHFTEPWCLMGAEDSWRWCARSEGTGIIGCGETTGPAPCRCNGCKAHGVVRIDH